MVSFQPLRVLTDEQVRDVHGAAERLLEKTGFSLQHDELLRRARMAGAHVEEAGGRVRIPAELLRDLLTQVPRKYCIRSVSGGSFEVGGGSAGVFAITNDPWIIDYESGVPRRPRLDDVWRNTMFAQCLDSVVCVSCMDYPVSECADGTSSWRALETHLLHHAKHNAVLAASPETLAQWLKIAAILNGGESPQDSRLLTCGVAVVSPLTLTKPNGDLLLTACTHGFPVLPTICPMAGTTSPYTLASTLLTAHAENVLMAAMTQIVRQGNPFQYAMGPSVSDMRSARDRYYTLDKVLWKVAGVQLAKAAGIPCSAECGGSMTPRYDIQTGAEGLLFMLAAYTSGADILAGLGSCYNANGLSVEMMAIQNAWLEEAKFLADGIKMDPVRLGFDNLATAGPGGHFLTDALTLEFCRGGEFFENSILDYEVDGKTEKPMLARAHEYVEKTIGEYVCPVPGEIREGLIRYFHDFYREAARAG